MADDEGAGLGIGIGWRWVGEQIAGRLGSMEIEGSRKILG